MCDSPDWRTAVKRFTGNYLAYSVLLRYASGVRQVTAHPVVEHLLVFLQHFLHREQWIV
jgi:hypothetical protein